MKLISNSRSKCCIIKQYFFVRNLLKTITPLFTSGVKDDNFDIISNSVFGLGVLVEATGTALVGKYPEMLGLLATYLRDGCM